MEVDPNTQQGTVQQQQPPVQQVPPAQDPAPPAPAGKNDVLTIPQRSMSKIRSDERRKGQEALAKRLGFSSVEEMEKTLLEAKAAKAAPARPAAQPRPAAPPAPRSQAAQPTRDATTVNEQPLSRQERRRLEELTKKLERTQREKTRAERVAKDATTRLHRTQAESQLRVIALRCGIREEHVPFALFQLKEHVSKMADSQLRTFRESEFFNGLRPRHPYIFAETPTAPTTGAPTSVTGKSPTGQQNGTANAGPTAPTPTDAAANNIQKPKSAMDMTPAEYQESLRALGINL